MANCSIPNSSPVSGRISTTSLRLSRKRNSASTAFFAALRLTKVIEAQTLSLFNAQRSTPNAQRSIQTVRDWMLGVGCWAFSSLGRVKGAWWPSRSSKPSSPRKWRGRFDSYPLRQIILIADCRLPRHRSDDFNRKSQFENRNWLKGGDINVA
jgi:hypothetical protein